MTEGHSPLGASGAERWMNCHGSVALIRALDLPESDEPDYRKNGTAAHAAAANCLETGKDAWEIAGEKFGDDVEIGQEIADAIQVYLDEARRWLKGANKSYVEFHVSAPEIHPDFYGTADFAAVRSTLLVIRDYKHGEGVIVEAEDNPQLLYYAYGVLRLHPEVETVNVGIVQPRGHHPDGPIREWVISRQAVVDFIENKIKPAMLATEVDGDLDAGSWCRFCPAKLVCPLMVSLFGAAVQTDPREIVELSDASVGRSYHYLPALKSYTKALEDEAYRRLNTGTEIDGIKLVHKKANRVCKPEAEGIFRETFGDDAYTKPEFKSPAELEKLGPKAIALVKEYAYTPSSGLTVALNSDKRVEVKVQKLTAVFGGMTNAGSGNGHAGDGSGRNSGHGVTPGG